MHTIGEDWRRGEEIERKKTALAECIGPAVYRGNNIQIKGRMGDEGIGFIVEIIAIDKYSVFGNNCFEKLLRTCK